MFLLETDVYPIVQHSHVPRPPIFNLDPIPFHSKCRALAEDFDNEGEMRKLFWKARARARRELKERLSELRDKRAAGLGLLFGGPSEAELRACLDSRQRELAVVEEHLVPVLENIT